MWTTMLLKQWIFLPSRVLRKDFLTRLALHLYTTVSSLSHLLFQLVQAAINATEEMPLPPQRSRKLPSRRHQPQLRLSIHQELKSMRTPALLPDSIMARLRPSPRTGSTAVVLWKPPPPSGSLLPDLVRPLFPYSNHFLLENLLVPG